MRILRRADFMMLPAGVFYAKGLPWAFNGFFLKGETLTHAGRPIDWIYHDLVDIDGGADSGERFDRLEEMAEKGASYPWNEDLSRDGCFDHKELFLVFETADLRKLRDVIDAAITNPGL